MPYDHQNIFAKILRKELPAHLVEENDHTFSFMDLMPLFQGHTLVICKEPAQDLFSISDEVLCRVHVQAQRIARASEIAFNPEGVTIAQLNRAGAGQSVFHFHVHVVPTWGGLCDFRGHRREMEDAKVLEANAALLRESLRAL